MECDGIFAWDTLYHKQTMYGINATEFLSGVDSIAVSVFVVILVEFDKY